MSLREISSDVYDSRTVWELPCELPYCFMRTSSGVMLKHNMAQCPIMRAAVAVYGDQSGQVKPLETDMCCLACQCGIGIVENSNGKRCEHCLHICYCSQRTFEKVGGVVTKEGICLMKVSDMEKRPGDDGKLGYVKLTGKQIYGWIDG